ncbi:SET domain-containing protein [Pholiota conissans]|uniref:Ribosomal lysine N-methyltransferase 4 n=1 Tax=Pholiota conissans TaxID=109636 RepID=A0A9P5Z6M9_9AGAR|nr:SET domain-containing protein [Pholiota conissans]
MSLSDFVSWFQSHNGVVDTTAIEIVDLPASEGYRGAVALKDIPEGHTVFSIPRTLVLSTRTSQLPNRFGEVPWRGFGLHEGWSGLMLCMMWEAALGAQSKWGPYFDIMPSTFDTPMFWNDIDLAELQGTSVVEKLGREQANKDYNEKVIPAMQSRPDLFNQEDISTRYSLETFHIMGSRILSRSFTLEKTDDAAEKDAHDDDVGNTSIGSAMDVDSGQNASHPHSDDAHAEGEDAHAQEEEGGSDDEEEVAAEVVMIPYADILNARYQTENVKLFYEPDCLRMVSTKPIKAGDQIWNTYGDLPNSELLRGFGHVDYLLLATGGRGNPGDVAELRADLIVQSLGNVSQADMEARIDWWLEEGGEDVFVLELPASREAVELPPDLLAFTRLISVDEDWARAQRKSTPPKPKADAATLHILHDALGKRLALYPTTLAEDEALEAAMDALSLNQRHALIVRMGEKRVLELVRARVAELLAAADKGDNKSKRKAESGPENGRKKRKE